MRRLLPASLLVLLAVLVADRVVAPATQWGETAKSVIAAASTARTGCWPRARSTTSPPRTRRRPVQHFWSLSVEEQFYFLWPLLIVALVACGTPARTRPEP